MHHAWPKEDDPKNEDDHKNEDILKNADDLKNEDNLKNDDNLKNEDDLKNEDETKKQAQLGVEVEVWFSQDISLQRDTVKCLFIIHWFVSFRYLMTAWFMILTSVKDSSLITGDPGQLRERLVGAVQLLCCFRS